MSKTNIEWATVVWNPTTGCNKVSQGCKNCYAEGMHKRLAAMGQQKYKQPFLEGVVEHPDSLQLPLSWKKPQRVFVNSMSDLFHEDVDFYFIEKVFMTMERTPQHTYMVLTKRPARMLKFFHWVTDNNLLKYQAAPNVWLGVSVENQETADERIPLLLQVPAAVRFLSCEPLLGPVDLTKYYFCTIPGKETTDYPFRMLAEENRTTWINLLNWVICGGESGSHARPMHPDWARSLRDQCQVAGIPFFFKQWGGYLPLCQYENAMPGLVTAKAEVQFQSPHNPSKQNTYYKVGKHRSGHLLDGKEHLAFPKNINQEE